jgi:hypothetical protein
MPTFPHQLKLLGATGWCRVANMVSELEVSNSNHDRHDLLKLITADSYSTFAPTGAEREGEC